MDRGLITKRLEDYPNNEVDIYINYLKYLESEKRDNKLVNYWIKDVKNEQFIDIFKKVKRSGVFIDGETVTLNWRKKLIVSYDYHAYKNIVLFKHPDSVFDAGVVYDGDSFSFEKDNGKVIYSHKMNNPFENNKKIIGAYCVLKNSKGEFIELLNMDTIEKMKNTSNMKFIWNSWFDRMVLKSALKRICNTHFKEITNEADSIDNETNDLNLTTIPEEIQLSIDEATDKETLYAIYNNAKNYDGIDTRALIKVFENKVKELGGHNE